MYRDWSAFGNERQGKVGGYLGLEHQRKKIDKVAFPGLLTTLDLAHDDWQIYVAKCRSATNTHTDPLVDSE